jgi:hypothetical protein
MTPPANAVQLSGGEVVWIRRPSLTEWTYQGSFDKAVECTNEQTRLVNSAIKGGKIDSAGRAELMMAECIATDDPRLKRK